MHPTDLALAIDWAAQEGWNPGLTDAQSFRAADPEGFLIAELDGEPVAVISAVRYGASYGFIGLYIVKPEYRGQGHGWAIWQAAMQRLQGRNIGLDGVVAQQDNYRRSGFVLAHRNARYAGVRARREADSSPDAAHSRAATIQVVTLTGAATPELLAYDREFFPEPRDAFIESWLAQPGTVALAAVDRADDNKLCGYGVLRPCRSGFKIGPLFADSPDAAELLFDALVEHVPVGESYFLDVMQTNPQAIELATSFGMQIVFETARMYTGAVPAISPERTYGITSFELG